MIPVWLKQVTTNGPTNSVVNDMCHMGAMGYMEYIRKDISIIKGEVKMKGPHGIGGESKNKIKRWNTEKHKEYICVVCKTNLIGKGIEESRRTPGGEVICLSCHLDGSDINDY